MMASNGDGDQSDVTKKNRGGGNRKDEVKNYTFDRSIINTKMYRQKRGRVSADGKQLLDAIRRLKPGQLSEDARKFLYECLDQFQGAKKPLPDGSFAKFFYKPGLDIDQIVRRMELWQELADADILDPIDDTIKRTKGLQELVHAGLVTYDVSNGKIALIDEEEADGKQSMTGGSDEEEIDGSSMSKKKLLAEIMDAENLLQSLEDRKNMDDRSAMIDDFLRKPGMTMDEIIGRMESWTELVDERTIPAIRIERSLRRAKKLRQLIRDGHITHDMAVGKIRIEVDGDVSKSKDDDDDGQQSTKNAAIGSGSIVDPSRYGSEFDDDLDGDSIGDSPPGASIDQEEPEEVDEIDAPSPRDRLDSFTEASLELAKRFVSVYKFRGKLSDWKGKISDQ